MKALIKKLSPLSLLVLMTPVMAGTSCSEFGGLYNLVNGWSEGFLGCTLAIAAARPAGQA